MDDQQAANAWVNAEARYQAGQEVRGIVTRVAQFGVFVQVEPGIEGIIYTFELGPGPGAMAAFAPGQEVLLYVKDIDARKKRLELSLEKHLMPGLLAERELPPDARRKMPLDESPGWARPLPPDLAAWHSNERICPACQRAAQPTWKYCVYCGGTLQRHCAACGTIQPDLPEARYCYECGKLLI